MAITSGSSMRERAVPQAADGPHDDAMSGIEVYALWRTPAERAIAAFDTAAPWLSTDANAAPRLGVAAVMPGQALEYSDMAALERAGLLAIEVPSVLQNADTQELRHYLSSQLADAQAAAAGSVPVVPSAVVEPDVGDHGPLQSPFSPQAEHLYLDALNDPQPVDELA